jgi:hypothetical protein
VPEPTRSAGQSKAPHNGDAAAALQARDVIAFGAETGRVLSDGRIVGRREPYAKVFPSSRAVKRAVGVTAWAILEDMALDADIDDQGRLVARTDVRTIADNLGINKQTVSTHLKKLREHGFVFWKQANSPEGFGSSLYVLDPSACIERFTVTPSDQPGRPRARSRPRPKIPRPKISDAGSPASEDSGHGGAGHDERGLQQEDVVALDLADEKQQQPPQPQSSAHDPAHPEPDAADLIAQLVTLGVTDTVATGLVAEHPADHIRAALHAARTKRRTNPAGWVVASITRGWNLDPAPPDRPGPPGPTTPEPGPSAAVLAFEQAADAALADLPAEDRAALEQRARKAVAGRIDVQVLNTKFGAGMVHIELRVLVAKHLGIPIPDDALEPDTATNPSSAPQ